MGSRRGRAEGRARGKGQICTQQYSGHPTLHSPSPIPHPHQSHARLPHRHGHVSLPSPACTPPVSAFCRRSRSRLGRVCVRPPGGTLGAGGRGANLGGACAACGKVPQPRCRAGGAGAGFVRVLSSPPPRWATWGGGEGGRQWWRGMGRMDASASPATARSQGPVRRRDYRGGLQTFRDRLRMCTPTVKPCPHAHCSAHLMSPAPPCTTALHALPTLPHQCREGTTEGAFKPLGIGSCPTHLLPPGPPCTTASHALPTLPHQCPPPVQPYGTMGYGARLYAQRRVADAARIGAVRSP